MNVLELIRSRGTRVRKVASTKGGEYHSPCPGCGGKDRFHVWPEQNEGKGSWWCRGCGKGGDNVQFLMDFDNKSFAEACRALDRPIPGRKAHRAPQLKGNNRNKSTWRPPVYGDPGALWQEKALKLVGWAHEKLMKNEEQLAWLGARGITQETAAAFKLGWNPEDRWRPRESWGLPTEMKEGRKKKLWIPGGLVIPYLVEGQAQRIRIRRPGSQEPRYYVLPGSGMAPMIIGKDREAFVVVESELDALMLSGTLDEPVGILALGSSSARPDQSSFEALQASIHILNALDFDQAGADAWAWWSAHFPQAERWPVPAGKDPGEAFAAGVDLGLWVLSGLPPVFHVGRSSLESQQKGKAENILTAPAPEAAEASQGPPRVDSPIDELFGLLRSSPVKIRVTPERMSILENEAWAGKNWNKSKRISELVYLDGEVFEYLNAHPDQTITKDNFWGD